MKLGNSPSRELKCPYCCPLVPQKKSALFQKAGHFYRRSDSKFVQRFMCMICRRTFSWATFHPCYYQKKRKLNFKIATLLASGVSQRRIARLLRVNRKTVVRKFLFLSWQAKFTREEDLKALSKHCEGDASNKLSKLQFDEMESFVHTKYLPVSIPMVVDPRTRKILGFRVASMPAKGLLAKRSRKRYGKRKDERRLKAKELFRELKPIFSSEAEILTDENPHYPSWIKSVFKNFTHKTTPGRRGRVVGQGELKEGGFDPLFAFNHTAAMLRANINRLFRRTWCTTKKLECLAAHIEIYVQYHNQVLLSLPLPTN